MGLPSGQRVAAFMGLPTLTPVQIQDPAFGPDGAVAAAQGFDKETPLWYYILKEAQIQQQGLRLGAVGATLVAEVFLGLLELDGLSYLAQAPAWKPTLPGKTAEDFTMVDLLNFVGDINPLGG